MKRLMVGALSLMAALAISCNPSSGGTEEWEDLIPDRADGEVGQSQLALLQLPAPVAYWKLNDGCGTTTVSDSSGNGYHGTRYNGAGCTDDGRMGRAGTFDLLDDRVEVPDRSAFHFTTAMTVAAWIKPTSLSGGRAVLNKWYAMDSYSLSIWEGSYSFSIALPGGTWGVAHSVSSPAVANQWAHVAGTYDGAYLRLYVNGVLKASKYAAGTLQQSTRPIVIGNHPSNSGFGGQIDEVRLYNVVLSAAQVKQLGQEVWPTYGLSVANSDPWLPQNHASLRTLRPTVLALNFVNAKNNTAMMSHLGQIANALQEATRYRAYRDASADWMVQYSFIPVDLRDNPPPYGWSYRNSTKYPRESPVQGYWGFDYAKLFSQEFAQYYGIAASDGHKMDLCELVNAGLVHEVWVYGDADVPDVSAAEVLERKPPYDANRVRIPGATMDKCAGNGCFDDEDIAALPAHCTRSIRIGWVNNTRGAGCYVESMGHGMESTGNRNIIPYLTTYFKEFADFNLNTRYGRPFESWYSCPGGTCLNHATACAHQELVTGSALTSSCSSSASTVCASDPYCCQTAWDSICVSEALNWYGGSVSYNLGWTSGTIAPYVPACGNAHFAPNSRAHYDIVSSQVQASTCENFRMRNGSGGADAREVFTTSKFSGYSSIASDCDGPWLVYWMQSMPGYANLAKDNASQPMLSWWPFRYY